MDQEKKKILDDTISRLGEHFDAVVILASSYEDGVTGSYARGTGNDFARAKMCEVYADDFANQRLADEIGQSINTDED